MMIFDNIFKFNGTWRKYQQRVLDQADKYLKDNKIHIVAAPGSGKTTLGIELIKRVNQPCLILSPSLVIRDQWLKRIKDAFLLNPKDAQEYLSTDINQPSLITSITYQALHAAITSYKGSLEDSDSNETIEVDYSHLELFKILKDNKIKTLCLDECHHLRNEWWKALEELKEEFDDFTVIALTATPPYDSTPLEWERYLNLCGEIDEEISVPELVNEDSICPHQDYVIFNYPTSSEQTIIKNFKKQADIQMQNIMQDNVFLQCVLTHPGLNTPEEYNEFFLDNPAYFSAILIYLQTKNVTIPKYLLKLINARKLPKISKEWLEYLLQGFLYDDKTSYNCPPNYREDLISQLKSNELIIRNKVGLTTNQALERMLINSNGKIKSINEIVKHESREMKNDLRLLILTDYIKKEYLKDIGNLDKKIESLGVIPFFEMIRRENNPQQKLGVLCGSVIIIPKTAQERLENLLKTKNSIQYTPLTYQNKEFDYLFVSINNNTKDLVNGVSTLFEEGYINILIGTKSLLGEGWDSPAVNSLILASFVGSYMLSNQMRGRAIRTFKKNPHKTSNIWHLVCTNDDKESLDYLTLQRRMDNFLGLHYSQNLIESGIERLDLIETPFSNKKIKEINRDMFTLSKKRELLKERWDKSLAIIKDFEIEDEVKVEKKQIMLKAILLNFFAVAILLIFIHLFTSNLLANNFLSRYSKTSIPILVIIFIFFTILYNKKIFLTIIKFINLFTPWKENKKVGNAILKSMQELELIDTPGVRVEIEGLEKEVTQYIYLKNGSTREKAIFAQAVLDFYTPIDNQRYIVVQKHLLSRWNYFCVPNVFSKNKKAAQVFEKALSNTLGNYHLIYTRTPEGRKKLLKARKNAYINQSLNIVAPKRKKQAKFK